MDRRLSEAIRRAAKALCTVLLAVLCLSGATSVPGAAAVHGQYDAIRVTMEAVHRGKVDPLTIERMVDSLQQMHETAHASGMLQQANFEADVSAEAARAFSQSHDGLPEPERIAQNAAPTPAVERTYVGQKTCEGCHQEEATNWAHTIHAKVFGLHPRDALEAQGCEACHGPGSAHVQNPSDLSTIISFSSKSLNTPSERNARCLACHEGGQRIFWHGSIHQSSDLSCSDCHNPMANFSTHGLTARESINETCFQCHKVQRAQFNERSHMPLLEGKISCADCHNPHGSTTPPLLKADSVNELCYTCHADKRGPFLFEHAPVRESCLNCHTPHGSNFEALLTTPRPLLCQQCHSQSGHPAQLMTAGNMPQGLLPDPRLIATSCQTCHVDIHGSNSPSGARFER